MSPRPIPTTQIFLLHYGVVPQNHSRLARFGVFELDLSAGELRKSGVKLRLQGQPFQVLALLLERAGEVVTREELQQKLWPSDTFVDFDHSLNTAINKVREALGDSASSPRYVETLARRGYRFIAPVQARRLADAPPQNERRSRTSTPRQSHSARIRTFPPVAMHPELEVPIPRRALTRGLFALIQVMYLAFYLVRSVPPARRAGCRRLRFFPCGARPRSAVTVMVTAGVGIPAALLLAVVRRL